MSLELTLYFDQSGMEDEFYGFNVLRMHLQDLEALAALQEVAVPLQRRFFRVDSEKGLTEETTDAYGHPLTSAPAQAIAHCLSRVPDESLSNWDQAVLAFLRTLPADLRAVLWWH